ncbi:MAG: DUF2207 domain-containing protein [Chloroflexi bacterium]|nr:DUF2207 domain-containing protein [Chloroflexota bacterium]
MPTGMLAPTPAGELEIGRWLALRESLAESPPTGARDHSEPMLAYAVALGVAEPWLETAAPAPPWFGAGGAAPLPAADRDEAYRAFIHSQWWGLPGRSDEAAAAAAGPAYELELELLGPEPPGTGPAAHREAADARGEAAREMEAPSTPSGAAGGVPPAEHSARRHEAPGEEAGGGGCLRGCLTWVAGAAGAGALVLVILLALDVVSPREKPCPLDSPPIPTPAQIAVAGDLFRDQCVAVRGTLVSRGSGELLLEVERGEYVQGVIVRDLAAVLDAIAPGRVVTLGGWLRVEEDGTYAVDFIPDRGSDRWWWQNLRDNLEALF